MAYTKNDLLAKFVREKHPEIVSSMSFAIFKADMFINAVAELITSITDTKKGDETNEAETYVVDLDDDVSIVYAVVRTSKGNKAIHNAEDCVKRQSKRQNYLPSAAKHNGHDYTVWQDLGKD